MADILPVGIPSAEAFGTPTVESDVSLDTYHKGIASGEAFGRPSLLGTITGIPLYTVFINGVDRSAYVCKPSIRRNLQIGGGSRATCDFDTVSWPNVGYRPAVDAEVVIFEGSGIFFGGTVESTEEMWFSGTSGLNKVGVKCTDWGTILDRRIVGKYYTLFLGGIAAVTIADIVRNFLDGTGITYDWTGTPGGVLGEQLFNYITAGEALNQICDKVNADYYVDFWKVLRLFPKSTGWSAAPFTIMDNDGNFEQLSIRRSRGRRVNRQGVRNSQSTVALWLDTYTASAGDTVVETTYFQEVKPVIYLNSVLQTVVEIADLATDSDFYYIQDGMGVFYRRGVLGAGDVVEVYYPSKLPPVYWAEDAASIALYGRHEAIEEVKDVPDEASMLALAQGILDRNSAEPVEANLVTLRGGCKPGQLLTIGTTKPPCTETLLIESISSQETVIQGQPQFRHTIRASNTQLARTNRLDNFMGRMVQRDKQPLDRITYKIGFVLAETIEGLTNPGLSVGAKPGIRVADKDGTLRDVKLYFKSVDDGTLTTSRIVIDIYCNGVSIFPAGNSNKLVFSIGATTPGLNYIFTANPYRIYKGDIFTHEVLEADAAAMDGVIEMVVLG